MWHEIYDRIAELAKQHGSTVIWASSHPYGNLGSISVHELGAGMRNGG